MPKEKRKILKNYRTPDLIGKAFIQEETSTLYIITETPYRDHYSNLNKKRTLIETFFPQENLQCVLIKKHHEADKEATREETIKSFENSEYKPIKKKLSKIKGANFKKTLTEELQLAEITSNKKKETKEEKKKKRRETIEHLQKKHDLRQYILFKNPNSF